MDTEGARRGLPRQLAQQAEHVTFSPVRMSSAPVGSSANSTSGGAASARATATRCCWPPDSWDGRWRRRWSSPTRAATPRTSDRRSRRPSRRIGRPMFWATVSDGIRLKAWNTKPICLRRRMVRRRSLSPSARCPREQAAPDVGRSRPAATWRNVHLPGPRQAHDRGERSGRQVGIDAVFRATSEPWPSRRPSARREARLRPVSGSVWKRSISCAQTRSRAARGRCGWQASCGAENRTKVAL